MFVTILFVVVEVGIELVLGLLLALMLAPKSRSNAAAATLLILPKAVTPVVSALVWRELFNPNYGWVNYYLRKIGIMGEPIAWLSNPQTSWFTVISLDVWQWTPFVALILMAGLQGIPPEPREAAAVDGAIVAKFRNGGQACTAANRFYVHADVADEFTARFDAAVEALRREPVSTGSDAGPLVSATALV